jgi:hypothetical protein
MATIKNLYSAFFEQNDYSMPSDASGNRLIMTSPIYQSNPDYVLFVGNCKIYYVQDPRILEKYNGSLSFLRISLFSYGNSLDSSYNITSINTNSNLKFIEYGPLPSNYEPSNFSNNYASKYDIEDNKIVCNSILSTTPNNLYSGTITMFPLLIDIPFDFTDDILRLYEQPDQQVIDNNQFYYSDATFNLGSSTSTFSVKLNNVIVMYNYKYTENDTVYTYHGLADFLVNIYYDSTVSGPSSSSQGCINLSLAVNFKEDGGVLQPTVYTCVLNGYSPKWIYNQYPATVLDYVSIFEHQFTTNFAFKNYQLQEQQEQEQINLTNLRQLVSNTRLELFNNLSNLFTDYETNGFPTDDITTLQNNPAMTQGILSLSIEDLNTLYDTLNNLSSQYTDLYNRYESYINEESNPIISEIINYVSAITNLMNIIHTELYGPSLFGPNEWIVDAYNKYKNDATYAGLIEQPNLKLFLLNIYESGTNLDDIKTDLDNLQYNLNVINTWIITGQDPNLPSPSCPMGGCAFRSLNDQTIDYSDLISYDNNKGDIPGQGSNGYTPSQIAAFAFAGVIGAGIITLSIPLINSAVFASYMTTGILKSIRSGAWGETEFLNNVFGENWSTNSYMKNWTRVFIRRFKLNTNIKNFFNFSTKGTILQQTKNVVQESGEAAEETGPESVTASSDAITVSADEELLAGAIEAIPEAGTTVGLDAGIELGILGLELLINLI